MATEARIRSIDKYQKKTYDRITFKVRKEDQYKEKFTYYAESLDISLTEFIIRSLNYVIDHKIKP